MILINNFYTQIFCVCYKDSFKNAKVSCSVSRESYGFLFFFNKITKQVNYDIQQYSLKVSGERKTFKQLFTKSPTMLPTINMLKVECCSKMLFYLSFNYLVCSLMLVL